MPIEQRRGYATLNSRRSHTGHAMHQYYQLLRQNPEFAKLWFGQVVSLTGDWFNTLVLSGLVAEYSDGSGLAISLFLMARFLPPMLVSPFAGVLLDRFNRKNILVASNALRALIVPLFLLANTPDMLWLIYVVTIIQFILSSVFEPGQAAIIPALVRPEDIIEGNTLMSVTWSAMLAIGAVIGGAFAVAFGAVAALLMDAFTFAIAAALLASVRYDPEKGRKLAKVAGVEPSDDDEDTSFIEGLRYLRRSPQVASGIFVKFGQSFGLADTLLTILGTQIFIIGARGELSLAILWSALGIGAVVGPVLTNLINDGSVRRMRRLILVGFVLMVVGWPIMGLANSIWAAALGLVFRAMGGSINWTYSNIIIQKSAPDAKLGRMFAIDNAGWQFAAVITLLIQGLLLDVLQFDIYTIIWASIIVSMIPLVIWSWWVPRLEHNDEQHINVVATPIGD